MFGTTTSVSLGLLCCRTSIDKMFVTNLDHWTTQTKLTQILYISIVIIWLSNCVNRVGSVFAGLLHLRGTLILAASNTKSPPIGSAHTIWNSTLDSVNASVQMSKSMNTHSNWQQFCQFIIEFWSFQLCERASGYDVFGLSLLTSWPGTEPYDEFFSHDKLHSIDSCHCQQIDFRLLVHVPICMTLPELSTLCNPAQPARPQTPRHVTHFDKLSSYTFSLNLFYCFRHTRLMTVWTRKLTPHTSRERFARIKSILCVHNTTSASADFIQFLVKVWSFFVVGRTRHATLFDSSIVRSSWYTYEL